MNCYQVFMYFLVAPTVFFGCIRCAMYCYDRIQWKKRIRSGYMSWEPRFPAFAVSLAVVAMVIGTIEVKTGVIVSNDCPKMKKETKVASLSKGISCKV